MWRAPRFGAQTVLCNEKTIFPHRQVAGNLDKDVAKATRHVMPHALICTSCADDPLFANVNGWQKLARRKRGANGRLWVKMLAGATRTRRRRRQRLQACDDFTDLHLAVTGCAAADRLDGVKRIVGTCEQRLKWFVASRDDIADRGTDGHGVLTDLVWLA